MKEDRNINGISYLEKICFPALKRAFHTEGQEYVPPNRGAGESGTEVPVGTGPLCISLDSVQAGFEMRNLGC